MRGWPNWQAPRFPGERYVASAALQWKMISSWHTSATRNSGLEPKLLELVNGCAYCLDLHTPDARALGETEQRINLLAAWREAPFYTDRESAALSWTEAVTRIADTHVPDDVYDEVRAHFSKKETVDLNWAVVAINASNHTGAPGTRCFRTASGYPRPPAPMSSRACVSSAFRLSARPNLSTATFFSRSTFSMTPSVITAKPPENCSSVAFMASMYA